jgi:hypothetical protein
LALIMLLELIVLVMVLIVFVKVLMWIGIKIYHIRQ